MWFQGFRSTLEGRPCEGSSQAHKYYAYDQYADYATPPLQIRVFLPGWLFRQQDLLLVTQWAGSDGSSDGDDVTGRWSTPPWSIREPCVCSRKIEYSVPAGVFLSFADSSHSRDAGAAPMVYFCCHFLLFFVAVVVDSTFNILVAVPVAVRMRRDLFRTTTRKHLTWSYSWSRRMERERVEDGDGSGPDGGGGGRGIRLQQPESQHSGQTSRSRGTS